MNLEELYPLAGDGVLDDIILDIKTSEASELNNQGVKEQVRFILESLGEEEGLKSIRQAINGGDE